jgi:hypothetical protein
MGISVLYGELAGGDRSFILDGPGATTPNVPGMLVDGWTETITISKRQIMEPRGPFAPIAPPCHLLEASIYIRHTYSLKISQVMGRARMLTLLGA